MQRVAAASTAENTAIALDRSGDVRSALTHYEDCARQLQAAIDTALPAHAEDQPKLVQHRTEILARVDHLKSLRGGAAPTIPLEQQIRAVQLGMQASSAASDAASSAGGVKTIGAVAAMGAVGGFMLLGGTIGAPLAVLGGATGAAYCATRQDGVGDAARKVGGVAIAGGERAQALNNEHNITGKVADVVQKAGRRSMEVNEKYQITNKVGAGINAGASTAQDVDEKYNVTGKVASGFSAVLSRLSIALSGPSAAASGAEPSTSTAYPPPGARAGVEPAP